MKKFKKIDFEVSVGLIILFVLVSIAFGDFTFLLGYFIVGGWHVISMLVHIFNLRNFKLSATRIIYSLLSLILLLTMPYGSYLILLYIAPFMAIFYTWLCYSEWKKMNERPLDILK